MFFAVILEDKTRLCVQASWVCAINAVNAYNYGVNHNEKKRIFFSKDDTATPKFLLSVRSTFCADEESCYLGQIKHTFATKSECLSYFRDHLIVLPAVYSTHRERQGKRSLLASEEIVGIEDQRSLQVKREINDAVATLRKAVRLLNMLVPVCDLTLPDANASIIIDDDESDVQLVGIAEDMIMPENVLVDMVAEVPNVPEYMELLAEGQPDLLLDMVDDVPIVPEYMELLAEGQPELFAENGENEENSNASVIFFLLFTRPFTAISNFFDSHKQENENNGGDDSEDIFESFDHSSAQYLQMRDEMKREIKAEIDSHLMAPLRESVRMLNTLLPVCDLTETPGVGNEMEVAEVAVQNENVSDEMPVVAQVIFICLNFCVKFLPYG